MQTADIADARGVFHIASDDDVRLAVWVEGVGPPMVLVHGTFGDHTAWTTPVTELRQHFTTYAMDRRGFGASGEGDEYSIDREFSDVAAVVEAVADRSSASVVLWGHSYGAACAMGGANLSPAVGHLILYEPCLGVAYPPGSLEAAEAALGEGDRETAVVRFLGDALEMSEDEIDALRATARWPVLLAGAHTAPRETRVEESWVYRPGEFDGISAPTLLLSGTESTAGVIEATRRAAAAISGSRIHMLEGHGHFAHRTDPAMVVAIIRKFVRASHRPARGRVGAALPAQESDFGEGNRRVLDNSL